MASPSRRRANGAYERPGTMKTFDEVIKIGCKI